MRKILMIGIGAMALAAAILVLFQGPDDEQSSRTGQPVGGEHIVQLPTDPVLPDVDALPPVAEPERTSEPEVPGERLDSQQDGLADQSTESPAQDVIAQPGDPDLAPLPAQPAEEPSPLEPEPTGITNISGLFFEDLAAQLVAGYHPPGSHDNPGAGGRLLLHFSALNRRYGLDLVGLEHGRPTLTQGREEIFENLFRPDVLETVWDVFALRFEQALNAALQETRRGFPRQGAESAERGLTEQEQQEFFRLLSNSAAALGQAVRRFADHENAAAVTNQWLQAQVTAFAAHSRYQQAEAELLRIQEANSEDQVGILAERLERDAAAKGIMQAIAAREQARERLLAMFGEGPSRPALNEGELVYLSEWLWRRSHAHPERIGAFRLLADYFQTLSRQVYPEGG